MPRAEAGEYLVLDTSNLRPGRGDHGRRWRGVIARTVQASTTDRLSLAAAGCAFYATLALFPGISMLLSIYGLLFDLATAEQHLKLLSGLLPRPAHGLIIDRVRELVSQPSGMHSASVAVGFLLTLWSCSIGTRSFLAAVNVAYEVDAQRPFLRGQAIGLAVTLAGVLCAVLTIGVVLALPAIIHHIGIEAHQARLIHLSGLAILTALFFGMLCLLYRYAPCRVAPPGRRVVPGAALATVLWLSVSELVSFYVARIGTFGMTYGSLATAVGLMLWFYASAYAVLLGAEFNAQLEEGGED